MASSVDKLEILNDLSDEWLDILDNELLDNIIKELNIIMKDPDITISPNLIDIFNFARLVEPEDILICFLGQDPYPNKKNAHGLSFSCLNGIPGSLLNIYKCLLYNKLISKIPTSGDLSNIAKQGVLFLNTALTTKNSISNSHKNLWKEYTDNILISLAKQNQARKNKPLIFVNWGVFAKNKISVIDQVINKDEITSHIYKLFYNPID